MRAENKKYSKRCWAEMPYCCFGDYQGSTVEKANFKAITDEYPGQIEKFWVDDWDRGYTILFTKGMPHEDIQILPETKLIIVEAYSNTVSLWFDTSDENLCDIEAGFNTYPVYDEIIQNDVEEELTQEYIVDLIEQVQRSCDDVIELSDEQISSIYEEVLAYGHSQIGNFELVFGKGCILFCRQEDQLKEHIKETYFK